MNIKSRKTSAIPYKRFINVQTKSMCLFCFKEKPLGNINTLNNTSYRSKNILELILIMGNVKVQTNVQVFSLFPYPHSQSMNNGHQYYLNNETKLTEINKMYCRAIFKSFQNICFFGFLQPTITVLWRTCVMQIFER